MIFANPMMVNAESVQVSDDLTIDLPSLTYKGSLYSAKLIYNGSCWNHQDLTKLSSSATKTATAGHNGFDFSAGDASPVWDNTDFYITSWAAIKYPSGYAYGDGLWVTSYDSNQLPAIDQGEVSLDSVVDIPTDWSIPEGTTDYPLIQNHVYIVKGRDGYGKFKVTSVIDSTAIEKMEVDIEYVYTSGSSF